MNRGVLAVAVGIAACARPAPVRRPTPTPPSITTLADRPSPPVWTDLAAGVRVASTIVDGDGTSPEFAWVVLRVDLAQATLGAEPWGRPMRELPRGLVAAFNAGFFEPDLAPSGLLAVGNDVFGRLDPRAGSGVFVVDGGIARVAPSTGFVDAARGLRVQCGPRVVEDGAPGIRRDDGRRFARSVLCLRDAGRTLDVIFTWDPSAPMQGPSLFALAQRLVRPSPVGDAGGCDAALNLDGGPSTGFVAMGGRTHAALGPVPWALTVRAR